MFFDVAGAKAYRAQKSGRLPKPSLASQGSDDTSPRTSPDQSCFIMVCATSDCSSELIRPPAGMSAIFGWPQLIQIMKHTLLTITSILAMSFAALAAEEKKGAADNTGKNERDRSGDTKTPGDQSNTPEDLKITQAIRQAVVKDAALTMTAKNVKIITAGGQVTLRGPVNTAEEKMKIEQLAKTAAGAANVDNQLEVKAAK